MSETYLDDFLTEVMKELRKKFRHMNEVCRLTKELADGLSRDDKVTAQMVLEMRGRELEEIGECDRHIQVFLASAQDENAEKLTALLNGNTVEAGSSPSDRWGEIRDIVLQTKRVWQQTVDIDKVISRRLAGEDSYYK